MKYLIQMPGDGLVQGEFMGLLFCWAGPHSDLPASAIMLFNTDKEAQEVINTFVQMAEISGSNALSRIKSMQIATTERDLETLAREAIAMESDPNNRISFK